MDRLLRKVREESGSEELGELEYVDTARAGRSWVPGQGQKTHPEVEILRLSLFKPLSCLLLKCLP